MRSIQQPEDAEIGFAEDEDMIGAVQAIMSRDRRSGIDPEVSVKADALGTQARRAVQSWMSGLDGSGSA